MPHPPPLVITSCHGEQFWLSLAPWVAHLRALDRCPIEIVSLDGGSYHGHVSDVTTYLADARDVKLQWGAVDPIRLRRVLFHLGRDLTCIQVDLDLKMKRDFSMLCDLPYDLIISRAFDFPSFAAEKLGFVACCGFYIAKPSARPLCDTWLHDLEQKTRQLPTDQEVLNAMMCGAPPPRKESVRLAAMILEIDAFEVAGCRIGVLPKEAIERSLDTSVSLFGNHARPIATQFLVKAVRRHPAKVLKHLFSMSPIGLGVTRLRDLARRAVG